MVSRKPSPVNADKGKAGGLSVAEGRLSELLAGLAGFSENVLEEHVGSGEFDAKKFVREGIIRPVDGLGFQEAGNKYTSVLSSTCFARVCGLLGVVVAPDANCVLDLSEDQVELLHGVSLYKVVLRVYSPDDRKNHIELTSGAQKSARVSVTNDLVSDRGYEIVCTSAQEFFNRSNLFAACRFYADEGAGDYEGSTQVGEVGREPRVAARDEARSQRGAGGGRSSRGFGGMLPAGDDYRSPPSVAEDGSVHGLSNVSGGVVRRKKRSVASKSVFRYGTAPSKNYSTSNAIMFNNMDEVVQDKISRDYAQEIIEELFGIWKVPMADPSATKYAEDLLWTFIISVTASNKADYDKDFDVPTEAGEVVVCFGAFSNLLLYGHGVTRRQFARAVADDLRGFVKHPDNVELLPALATRVGCELQFAHLAFDGSTHCSGLNPKEIGFTKTLESRNLFERDDVLAQGASGRMLQSADSGSRNVAVSR